MAKRLSKQIIIPDDRTTRQPVVAYCLNLECLEDGERFEFPTEGDVKCPKCGAKESPIIGVLSLVHFLVKDNVAGLIGGHGARFRMVCDPKRAYLATFTNLEAATDDLECVNCPQCLKVAEEQKLTKRRGTVFSRKSSITNS